MDRPSLADLRREYMHDGLEAITLDPDPIAQLATWIAVATDAGVLDATAVTLATATPDGRPSARVVLLKGIGADGLRFFTNFHSRKGRELDGNPHVAMCFFWPELARQVRVEGRARRLSLEESTAYWRSRPRESQLGAWASPQSERIAGRAILDEDLAAVTRRFAGIDIPLPGFWGGFLVEPDAIELWQGRPSRLHDRFRYTRAPGSPWTIERLAP